METTLITGATRGIGRGLAERLAAESFRVLLGARDIERGRKVAASMNRAVEVVELDMASSSSIEACVRSINVPIDLLVNNAGVYHTDERTIWAVNVHGPILLTRALDAKLAKDARIANVTSGLGRLASQPLALRQKLQNPELTIDDLLALPPAGYGESKAVLNAFTRLLAREWPQRLVNSVSPGWVKTDMGGPGAPREIEQGVASVLACCHLSKDAASGRVFEDSEDVGF